MSRKSSRRRDRGFDFDRAGDRDFAENSFNRKERPNRYERKQYEKHSDRSVHDFDHDDEDDDWSPRHL